MNDGLGWQQEEHNVLPAVWSREGPPVSDQREIDVRHAEATPSLSGVVIYSTSATVNRPLIVDDLVLGGGG